MQLMHTWESNGYKPPYRCVGIASLPTKSLAEANPFAYSKALAEIPKGYGCGSCSICGTPLVHNYLMMDAEGARFAVGSDCVKKSGNAQLVSAIEKERLAFNRAKAKARRDEVWAQKQAAHEAVLEAERSKNGGLTDYELEQQKKMVADAESRAARVAANRWVVEALSGCWMTSTLTELSSGRVSLSDLSRGGLYRLAEEYGKLAGRKKSKAWQVKFDEFWVRAGIPRE